MKLHVTLQNVRRKPAPYGTIRGKGGRSWVPVWNAEAHAGAGAYAIEVRDESEGLICVADLCAGGRVPGFHIELTAKDKELVEAARKLHRDAAEKAAKEAAERKAANDKQRAIDQARFDAERKAFLAAQKLANDPVEIQRKKDAADKAFAEKVERERAAYRARQEGREAGDAPAVPAPEPEAPVGEEPAPKPVSKKKK